MADPCRIWRDDDDDEAMAVRYPSPDSRRASAVAFSCARSMPWCEMLYYGVCNVRMIGVRGLACRVRMGAGW